MDVFHSVILSALTLISLSENSFDIERIFHELKAIGYPLKVLLCDESMGQIAQIAKQYFPNVVIQICLTH